MKNCESALLIGLISIILIVMILIGKNNNMNNKKVEAAKNNLIENFQNSGETVESLRLRNQELENLIKMQNANAQSGMSKYVLKSSVEKAGKCPDMSKYMLKSAVPPPVKCPTINRDEWVRKSGLPPNWNKECPKQPDLSNFVLKTTIPPTQKCPSCVCPKIKVDAGLCKEPNKDDCMKSGACKDACPPPEPCPKPECPPPPPINEETCRGVVKCPAPKACPPPPKIEMPKCPPIPEPIPCPRPPPPPPCPKPTCPTCPAPPPPGKCPTMGRCPPSEDCPKCYGVKYVKVPVVKSEPFPKPEKKTIFPETIIDTKLIRQEGPQRPRQPRVLRMEAEIPEPVDNLASDNAEFIKNLNDNNMNNNNNNNNNKNNNNNSRNNIAPSYSNNVIEDLNNHLANSNNNSNYAPSFTNNNGDASPTCGKISLNNTFQNFGVKGFNNNI